MGDFEKNEAVNIEQFKFRRSVNIIGTIYTFLFILLSILTFIGLIGGLFNPNLWSFSRLFVIIVLLGIWGMIIYGLHKIKPWIVPYMIYSSWIGIFWSFIGFYSKRYQINEGEIEFLFLNLIDFSFILFGSFQVIIFTKRETEKFFGDRGKTVF